MTEDASDVIKNMSENEYKLRMLLAFKCTGALLYCDDGELSDSSAHPGIDFLRDSPDNIQTKLRQRQTKVAEKSTTKPPTLSMYNYKHIPKMTENINAVKALEYHSVNRKTFLKQDISVLKSRVNNSYGLLGDKMHVFKHKLFTDKPEVSFKIHPSVEFTIAHKDIFSTTFKEMADEIDTRINKLYRKSPEVEKLTVLKDIWESACKHTAVTVSAFLHERAKIAHKFNSFNIKECIDKELATDYVHYLYVFCAADDESDFYMPYSEYIKELVV